MSYHNLSHQSTMSKHRPGGSSLVSQSSFGLRSSPSTRFANTRMKKKKITQSALLKRGLFHVIDDNGNDKTPKLLYDVDYQVLEEWQPTVLDYVEADLTSQGSQVSLARNFQQSAGLSYGSRTSHTISLQMSFTNIANVESYKEASAKPIMEGENDSITLSEDRLSETAASAFRLAYVPSRQFYPPHSKVPIVCRETNSVTLFSLVSNTEPADSPQGQHIQQENAEYEYITVGRGKYSRKLNTSEQQTPSHIHTSQSCLISKYTRKNNWTHVRAWNIYDEYLGVTRRKKDVRGIPPEDQWAQLTRDEKFQDQILIMERILGAGLSSDVQLAYKGLFKQDPLDLNAQFLHAPKTLWTYSFEKIQNRAVAAISINPEFPDIIAVGYGVYSFKDIDRGCIALWCVKNLQQPERFYKFSSPVTCVDFAESSPNILAAGFMDGSLLVLDVTKHRKKVLYKKDSIPCNTYDAIVFVKWWTCIGIYGKQEERIMATTRDGRIIQLRRRFDRLDPFQMMRTSRLEGKVKGIECLRKCDMEEIPMVRFPTARAVVRNPEDRFLYLVAADDGAVHKCSANFFTQHIDAFLAHMGPVYALKFSPFCSRIYLTCGADGAVRLWAWDIYEPLITLTTGPVAVQDAAWSPANSTIIASISGPCLHIWDLRRKTYFPASSINHPSNSNYCALQFTTKGDNLIVGDVEGNVHVLALMGMPFDQIYKQDVLAASIEKELVVKPQLLKLLKKTGPPFTPP